MPTGKGSYGSKVGRPKKKKKSGKVKAKIKQMVSKAKGYMSERVRNIKFGDKNPSDVIRDKTVTSGRFVIQRKLTSPSSWAGRLMNSRRGTRVGDVFEHGDRTYTIVAKGRGYTANEVKT
tara:strand:+ start:72 stop:431 length:360 start_codon:yes stop_codon:yes gene_type:complete